MVSYASKHGSQSLSDQSFLRIQCTYIDIHNSETSGHMWTFNMLNDYYIIGGIHCVVQSCTTDLTGELRTELCIGYSLILLYYILCIYSKPVYTLLIGTQLCLTTKLMGLTIEYYTTNNSLTANDASFNIIGQLYYTSQWVDTCTLISAHTVVRCANFSRYYRTSL